MKLETTRAATPHSRRPAWHPPGRAPLLAANRLDDAISRRHDQGLHLHGLENDQSVTGLDPIAWRHHSCQTLPATWERTAI